MRVEVRGLHAIAYPDGGMMWLTRGQLAEYWRTGELKPYSDPGMDGLIEKNGMLVRTDAPKCRVCRMAPARRRGVCSKECARDELRRS